MYDAWNSVLAENGAGWYLIGHHLRGGDLYHACSLMPHFVATHAAGLPIYVVLQNDRQASVAAMFAEHFERIIVAPGFPESFERWAEFFAATGLPTFGPNTPVLLHPQISQETTRFSTEFLDQNRHLGVTWMQLHKQVMHLPGTVEPIHPVRRAEPAQEARVLCEAHGVPPGWAVILFPYAQSIPVDSIGHFAALATILAERGRQVFTSVALDEQPVPGTRPIRIPFALLPYVAEYASWVVAVRSGICDIVSPVPCRKSFIYPNPRELRLWSVAALNLARDAVEITFDFQQESSARLVERVLSEDGAERLPAIRDVLTGRIGNGQSAVPVTTLSFTDIDGRPVTLERQLRGGAGVSGSVRRLLDVPPRIHPWTAARTNKTLRLFFNRLRGNGIRFYTCRDTFDADRLEEVDRAALIEGNYFAAGFWHSIVATDGCSLSALMPPGLQDAVLPAEPVALGEWIRFAEVYVENVGRQDPGARPIACGGLRLVNGWSDLEPWGIWTSAQRCTLAFTLPDAPAGEITATLDVAACVSTAFPALSFEVRAGGQQILSSTMTVDAPSAQIDLVIPASCCSDGTVTLVIEFDELRSPEQQGGSSDKRRLGLALNAVRVSV